MLLWLCCYLFLYLHVYFCLQKVHIPSCIHWEMLLINFEIFCIYLHLSLGCNHVCLELSHHSLHFIYINYIPPIYQLRILKDNSKIKLTFISIISRNNQMFPVVSQALKIEILQCVLYFSSWLSKGQRCIWILFSRLWSCSLCGCCLHLTLSEIFTCTFSL